MGLEFSPWPSSKTSSLLILMLQDSSMLDLSCIKLNSLVGVVLCVFGCAHWLWIVAKAKLLSLEFRMLIAWCSTCPWFLFNLTGIKCTVCSNVVCSMFPVFELWKMESGRFIVCNCCRCIANLLFNLYCQTVWNSMASPLTCLHIVWLCASVLADRGSNTEH